ncbi:hypothetical protein OFK41_07825 [Acinetobacter baumannii]|uniref:hypothetical protein n=1 Tax=Acinetobacter baumannii TaxID=470 RepID=UPI00225A48E2|nr:hypothetical protein [Acinetobacter baumannii]MCX3034115.1 hypothetical protein [Acinetobacter baumannii]
MSFNLSLDNFLHHQLFKQQSEGVLLGPLSITLPIDLEVYVAEKAKKYAGVSVPVDRGDILRAWGTFDKFFEWRDAEMLQGHEVNFNFLCGIIYGLVMSYKIYHVEVMKTPPELIEGLDIDIPEYVRDIFNIKN